MSLVCYLVDPAEFRVTPVNLSSIGLRKILVFLLDLCVGDISGKFFLLALSPSTQEIVADGGGLREVSVEGFDLLVDLLEELVAEVEFLHGAVVEVVLRHMLHKVLQD